MRAPRTVPAVVVMVCLLASACGSSHEESEPTTTEDEMTRLSCPEAVGELPVGAAPCVAAESPTSFDILPLAAPKKTALESQWGGLAAAQPQLRARLAGWPTHLLAEPAPQATSDRALLRRIAADTWTGLAALTDREHGIPVNHVRFTADHLDGVEGQIGDYASVSDIGLYLMAIAAARELDFLDHDDAAHRTQAVLVSLEKLETYKGHWFNYYDTTTLERTSRFVSFVDSGWCVAGLMVARGAFPELAARIDPLIARNDFRFFYDEGLRRMSHGVDVDAGRRSPYHYGTFFTEARVASLIAIGKGDVPPGHWYALDRGTAPACAGTPAWPSCGGGVPAPDVWISRWNNLPFVASWGGSLFEALMPSLVVDERSLSRDGLGANAAAHVEVHRQFALEERGWPVWGMSPAMDPNGNTYAEYGVEFLGARGYPSAAVAPYASALSLAVAPAEAADNLRRLIQEFPVYGEYGFYDAVDPRTKAVSYTYLALDQAMILISIANAIEEHIVQNLFTADPIAHAAIELVRRERWFADLINSEAGEPSVRSKTGDSE